MPALIVLASPPDHRDFISNVLRSSGWDVMTLAEAPRTPADASGIDLILVDLAIAVAEGWIDPKRKIPPPAPLIVMSRFAAFLQNIKPKVAGILHLPTTDGAILETVAMALDPARAPKEHPMMMEDAVYEPLDNGARDAAITTHILSRTDLDAELSSIASLVARGVGVSMGLVTVASALIFWHLPPHARAVHPEQPEVSGQH